MRNVACLCLASILAISSFSSSVVSAAPVQSLAREAYPRNFERVSGGKKQGWLAQQLVSQLGWEQFLPSNPTQKDYFDLLTVNGMCPRGGWNADTTLSHTDFARTMVQAWRCQTFVTNQDNDGDWIDAYMLLLSTKILVTMSKNQDVALYEMIKVLPRGFKPILPSGFINNSGTFPSNYDVDPFSDSVGIYGLFSPIGGKGPSDGPIGVKGPSRDGLDPTPYSPN